MKSDFCAKCGQAALLGLCLCVGWGPAGEAQLSSHAVSAIVAKVTAVTGPASPFLTVYDQTIGLPRSGVLAVGKPERALGPTGSSGVGPGGFRPKQDRQAE